MHKSTSISGWLFVVLIFLFLWDVKFYDSILSTQNVFLFKKARQKCAQKQILKIQGQQIQINVYVSPGLKTLSKALDPKGGILSYHRIGSR
jgi:hypothetical protein